MLRLALVVLCAIALPACRTERADRRACGPAQTTTAAARPPRKYAVIVNGDTERRHKHNALNAWQTLTKLGFAPENIFVLTTTDRRVPLPNGLLRFRPVQTEFAAVMGKVAAATAPGDTVVIYGTGHGDTSQEGESYLELRRGEVWAFDLRDEVETVGANTVVVMDQCFSGGFIDAFEDTTRRAIVITTVDRAHPTDCSYFAEAFWASLIHPERADRNGDGKTSVREAFAAALKAHQDALEGDPELRANGECRSFNGLEDLDLN